MTKLARIVFKAAGMFLLINLLCVVSSPETLMRRFNLYHTVVPARVRLPYAGIPAESYSISLTDLTSAVATHEIAGGIAPDSVILLGDSSVWGWLLEPDQTLSACLNQSGDMRAYNLGYPLLNVTKDLLILDAALSQGQPALVVWFVTLAALYPQEQLSREIIRDNAPALRSLSETYPLGLALDTLRDVPDWKDKTLIGRRRTFAEWIQIQAYGLAWAATGIDHRSPKFVHPVREALQETPNLVDGTPPQTWSRDDLAFDVLIAGHELAQAHGAEVLIVNEPIYRSAGIGSHERYSFLYPRWAYDQYRQLLADLAAENDWHYWDAWDALPPDSFTDSEFHLTPHATCQLAEQLREYLP